ncbi:MAG: pilus assembly protein TadE [Austwickia sp.]|nr:MAG: pilus assembly protein TadE [Austwickia sp.]
MVTAETALVLPVVVVVLAVSLAAMRYGVDQVRCLDAARAGARAAARGDSPDAIRDVARRGAPQGAEVAVTAGSQLVTVRVRAPVPAPMGALAGLPPPQAEAVAQAEPGIAGVP